ncbi:hypothetical protein KSP40_PGU020563 [Platanthera guangdongensis]|uniref:Uncharacterized protein n=1 Tax=Platanthera guangdongensis TaxID=2320717 RepID=A0ABR2LLV9_9ASPA
MDKAAEEVYNKLLELHEEQKRDKGEDKLTTEEAYTMVLGKRSGYIPGMGPGPKPLDRESTNGQRLRAQIQGAIMTIPKDRVKPSPLPNDEMMAALYACTSKSAL